MNGFALPREDQERERHDRQAAELDHCATVHEGHALPPEHRLVHVRSESDQGTERREQQRKRNHDADEGSRHVQFDDHHPVQRSNQQDQGHADGELEQGQSQEPGKRQIRRRGVGERKKAGSKTQPKPHRSLTELVHLQLTRQATHSASLGPPPAPRLAPPIPLRTSGASIPSRNARTDRRPILHALRPYEASLSIAAATASDVRAPPAKSALDGALGASRRRTRLRQFV